MELSYFIVILFGLFGQGYQQTANEQNDPNLKKQVVMERSLSGSITFSCTFEIQDVSNKFVNGEFVVSWSKVQNSTDVILNNGPVLRYLPDGMKEHLSYNQKTENTNTLRTAITIKDPRPEESGQYRCELKWSSSTNGGHSSQLTYTLNVIDSDEFQVILYGNDNPMLVPRKPNITSWPSTKTIQLDEKPQDILKPQQYAYLACVASGPSVTAVVTVTLNSTENPERNRNLHGRMDSIIISEYVGPEIGAQKEMIWNLLEDRSFPVDSRDDGATVTCVGTVENEDNQEVLHKEVSAVLNLLMYYENQYLQDTGFVDGEFACTCIGSLYK
ncbi:hypothetical protein LSH36_182g06022 [Paralvinella palmiformis]|uniref:Ig-like domain-containing protein n=1 Tax=Paralvinella palmiformis TaxID=53620 RepID=A0AAD9JRK4_9ANNE|nr:hypothetical protein LSH36_182g06022 [Paralvinella palmiformis]